jgi:hypothetical protein
VTFHSITVSISQNQLLDNPKCGTGLPNSPKNILNTCTYQASITSIKEQDATAFIYARIRR